MRILGYLLLFFNLVAGAGYLYLAIQDWNRRQTITAVGLAQYVRLQGVPVDGAAEPTADAIPFPVDMDGIVVTTVGPQFLEAYFKDSPGGPQLGGGPVTSQVAEAKRVKAKIEQAVDGAADDAARARMVYGFLEYGAENYAERAKLRAMRDAVPPDLKGLRERLDAAFEKALTVKPLAVAAVTGAPDAEKLSAAAAARGPSGDEVERATAVAHLLANLDPTSADWQKRVAAVAGLRTYTRAVGVQTARWAAMASEVALALLRDQEGYVAEYEQLRDLARDRTEQVRSSFARRQAFENQRQRDQDLVAQRTTQLADVTRRLQDAQAEIQMLLGQQGGAEKRLFEIQQKVGATLDEIFRLEEMLAARERGLAAAAGKK